MSKTSLPKLVNVSDTSDSDSSLSSEDGKGKGKVRARSRSRGLSREKSRSRGKSKDRSRERSRDRSRERRHERRHERRSSSDRRKYRRSRSPRRSRDHREHRRDRDRSPRHRRRSPPRGSGRGHKTMSTLEKLGIELKPGDQGNSLPSYYNHMAINPARYAQQLAKRKLIWGNKGDAESTTKSPSLWQGATFSQDQDGKLTAKFKRLMGIKEGEGGASGQAETGQDLIKRQQELFSSMEIQYEAARQATHTQRGVGLGFGPTLHQ